MLKTYHQNPILGIYYLPRPDWTVERYQTDILEIVAAGIRSIWLFFDPFYDVGAIDRLRTITDLAGAAGLTVVPVLGQFLQLADHPDVKIVNADGTTSDDPRYWNMGCFRHPKLLEIATGRATGFFRDFGEHDALYRLAGKPVMNFVHEAYYRNSVPEFGGEAMQPNCYCEHCLAAFRDYLSTRGLTPDMEPPRDAGDPVLWQHWLDCHAQAIPQFLHQLITATKAVQPVWATHECNDFYPASWQSVYTGNDWWQMGEVLDFGHEDMYPLEFDHRYQCYVYDYTRDVMRSAVGFDKLITGNGQAFNAWLGYQLPYNSMSEQVYSSLAHGALGLVWWGDWHSDDPEKGYQILRQTKQPNRQYLALVEQLNGMTLSPARIALLYSWTTMSQALNDDHTYDTLFTYMMLVQSGYPVDILSEDQVRAGILHRRNYQALAAMGCAALPRDVHVAIDDFVTGGGLAIADHAPFLNERFPPLCEKWRNGTAERLRTYTLTNGTPVPVQLNAVSLVLPPEADVLATFNNKTPAIARLKRGKGAILLMGSYLGWDYTNYPGYYDLAAMFPFHIRRDEVLRQWFVERLTEANIHPPACADNPDVEVALWQAESGERSLLIVINHRQHQIETTVQVSTPARTLTITLEPLEGRAIWLAQDPI